MDTSKLKTYAPKARREFIAAVTRRAAKFGITAKGVSPVREEGQLVIIEGEPYPKAVAAQRNKLATRISQQGFHQVMEAAAYTWFNRFAAIRFMELHGYLDHGYRVLSHPEGRGRPPRRRARRSKSPRVFRRSRCRQPWRPVRRRRGGFPAPRSGLL